MSIDTHSLYTAHIVKRRLRTPLAKPTAMEFCPRSHQLSESDVSSGRLQIQNPSVLHPNAAPKTLLFELRRKAAVQSSFGLLSDLSGSLFMAPEGSARSSSTSKQLSAAQRSGHLSPDACGCLVSGDGEPAPAWAPPPPQHSSEGPRPKTSSSPVGKLICDTAPADRTSLHQ